MEIQFSDEILNGSISVIFGGIMDGVLLELVDDHRIGAVANEELEHGDIAILGGEHERGAPPHVLGVGVDLKLGDEVLGGIVMAVEDGEEESVPSDPAVEGWHDVALEVFDGDMGVGPVLDEKFECGKESAFGGDEERNFVVPIDAARIGPIV